MKRQRGLSTAWAIVIAAGLFVCAGVGMWWVEYRRGELALDLVETAYGEAFPAPDADDQAAAIAMAGKMLRRFGATLGEDAIAKEDAGAWTVGGMGCDRSGRVVPVVVVMLAVRHAGGRRWQLEVCHVDGERLYP